MIYSARRKGTTEGIEVVKKISISGPESSMLQSLNAQPRRMSQNGGCGVKLSSLIPERRALSEFLFRDVIDDAEVSDLQRPIRHRDPFLSRP